MIFKDQVLGKPLQTYTNTKTNIEALPNSVEGMTAYASDTDTLGIFTSTSGWVWNIGGGGSGTPPGTLSYNTTNDATNPHTHAITASSNPGVAESLLKTDSNGDITLPGIILTSSVPVKFTLFGVAGSITWPLSGTDKVVNFPNVTGQVALGAATVTVATANSSSIANHTHAITASNNPGISESILKTDSSGTLIISAGGAATIGFQAGLTAHSIGTTYGTTIGNSVDAATTVAIAAYGRVYTTAGAFTLDNAVALYADNPSKGAGSTITSAFGLVVNDITAGASNYAIQTGAGLVNIQDTTDSTTSSTGAIVTGGGVGIAKALTVGTIAGIGISPNASFGMLINHASQAALYRVLDAGTANTPTVLELRHRTSGTAAAGFGSLFLWTADSNTTANRLQHSQVSSWVVATDASRTARVAFNVYDTAAREAIRIEASGTAPMIGFLGANAVTRQTGGAATAGGTYTATEQSMLQKAYDALRTFGLLT